MIFAKKQNKYSAPKESLRVRIKKEMSMNYELYWMFIPVAIYFLLFAYKPMYGLLMAFQDYSPRLGISGSEWVGFGHFTDFFKSFYFGRLMKNTVTNGVKVKASSGIRTREDALALIEAGAERLGTSAGIKIVEG